jgi:hypothetical protein
MNIFLNVTLNGSQNNQLNRSQNSQIECSTPTTTPRMLSTQQVVQQITPKQQVGNVKAQKVTELLSSMKDNIAVKYLNIIDLKDDEGNPIVLDDTHIEAINKYNKDIEEFLKGKIHDCTDKFGVCVAANSLKEVMEKTKEECERLLESNAPIAGAQTFNLTKIVLPTFIQKNKLYIIGAIVLVALAGAAYFFCFKK